MEYIAMIGVFYDPDVEFRGIRSDCDVRKTVQEIANDTNKPVQLFIHHSHFDPEKK